MDRVAKEGGGRRRGGEGPSTSTLCRPRICKETEQALSELTGHWPFCTIGWEREAESAGQHRTGS